MTRGGVGLSLYDNVMRSDAMIANLGDGYTGRLQGYWRSIRARGGYWLAGGDFVGPEHDLIEMYVEGIGRRLVENIGGMVTWEGLVVEMDLTLGGVTYRRSLLECANAVRAIYTKVGDNLFSDGSAESGAWTQVGTPSTHERVTTWSTDGLYGMHVVTDAADEGTEIETGIAITAGTAYQCRVSVTVEAGTWTLAIQRSDTSAILAQAVTSGTGDSVLWAFISEENDYTGNVFVRITASAASEEIYADAAVFQTSPARAETGFSTDDDSIAEWGRIENVLLMAAMSDAAATALVTKEVAERAWPRSQPPDEFEIEGLAESRRRQASIRRRQGRQCELSVLFAGYVWTLNWLYLLAGGTDTATNHITSLVGESEFVTAGAIESNTLSCQVEQEEPVRLWDAIDEIISVGDASGNRWIGGVYADRTFNYEQASTTVEYHYRGGRMLAVHGGVIAPWSVLPGLARLDDAPVGPGALTGNDTDDPRNVYLEEVEYVAPDGLRLRRKVD